MMYPNESSGEVLTLASLDLSPVSVYPAFVFGALTYLVIMFCNMLVLITIVVTKKLHTPMFILLSSLPVSDMIGASAFFPHLLYSMVTDNRQISYPACMTQAFLIHFYGTANFIILTAMAYDRYIAICNPLRYNVTMNAHNLIRILMFVWCLTFALIATLFLLLTRFKTCRTNVVDLFCNNPSLMKLACGDTRINNYYGMFAIAIIMGCPLLIITYTYVQILRTCMMTNQRDARTKAIQTCGTHLIVFLIFQVTTAFTLIAHRFGNSFPNMRKAFGVSVLIIPPVFDPIIYGLKTKELKQNMFISLKRNFASNKL